MGQLRGQIVALRKSMLQKNPHPSLGNWQRIFVGMIKSVLQMKLLAAKEQKLCYETRTEG